MAEIELDLLKERLSEDEYSVVVEKLSTHLGDDFSELPLGDRSASGAVSEDLDEDALGEFMARLDSYDLNCDFYVPMDFEGRLEAGDYRVGSVHHLSTVLEDLMEELEIEDDDPDLEEEEDDDPMETEDLLQSQMRGLWRAFHAAVSDALDAQLTLVVVR